ncbi:MAG: hypothetical protein WA004_11665 [Saprospiraceae bacterium]
MAFFLLPGEAYACCDIKVEIVDLEVTKDGTDSFSGADVYVNFRVKRPQSGHHGFRLVGTHDTPVLDDQKKFSKPHTGYSFTMVHFDPFQVEFTVYDSDWPDPDDEMASGILVIGIQGPYFDTWVGEYATISIMVTVEPSYCGHTRSYLSRNIGPLEFPVSQPLAVDLMLHVQEDEPTDWLVLREYIPASLAFIAAEPMPDAIETWTLEGEPAGQILLWKLENPPGGEHFFQYWTEPVAEEPDLLRSSFSATLEWTESDGDFVSNHSAQDGFTSIVIGGNDDCDDNGLYDRAEIALDPSLDADGDLRLDICQGSFISTPDLTATAGEVLVVPVSWELLPPGVEIRDFSFFVGFEAGAMEFLGPQTEGTLLETDTWQVDWFMASDTHSIVYAYGEIPLLNWPLLPPLVEIPIYVSAPLTQQPPVRIFDFVFNELSTWTVPVSNGAIISGVKEAAAAGEGLQWELRQSEGEVHVFFDLPQAAEVTLRLWDITGKPLGELATVQGVAGKNQLTAQLPAHLPSGIYVVEFRAGEERRSGRVKW